MKNNPILYAIFLMPVAFALSGCSKSPGTTATVPPPTAAIVSPGDSERTLTVDGLDRSYLLHVPAGLAADQPLPLVLVFHGYTGNAESMAAMTGFNGLADAYGFLVVYPVGTGPAGKYSWNAEGCCGFADDSGVDDEGFVRKIISDLQAEMRIDQRRVYAAGFSNGAMLSYRLACEMSDTFAAVAPVAGVLLNNPCHPAQPVSIIHIHGLADYSVSYSGSSTPAAAGVMESVQQSIATWVQLDSCPATAQVEFHSPMTHTIYRPCKSGTAVELYALKGIGHIWPPETILPASKVIWNFFVAHPKA